MTALHRLWSGAVPLERAFWSYALIGGIAVNLVTTLVMLVLVSADRPVAALIAGYGVSVPYNVVALVGVWRAADRDDGARARANLYRIVTLAFMVILSLT